MYVRLFAIGRVSDATFFIKRRLRTRLIHKMPTKTNLRLDLRFYRKPRNLNFNYSPGRP